jgi:hypothetical protein
MDLVLRDRRHLTHVPERGLTVLVGRRLGLISGHLDHCCHQRRESWARVFAVNTTGPLRVIESFSRDLIGCAEPAKQNDADNHLPALRARFRGIQQVTQPGRVDRPPWTL